MTKPTSPAAIRAARHKRLATPSGFSFTIRKLSPLDVLLCGGDADLAALARADEATLAASSELRAKAEAFSMRIVRRALVGVRLRLKERPTYAADELFAGDVPREDMLFLVKEILAWSGLTKEAARALDPSSATREGSSLSTPSHDATDAARARSSGATTPSSPTPSTPPAPAPDSSARPRS